MTGVDKQAIALICRVVRTAGCYQGPRKKSHGIYHPLGAGRVMSCSPLGGMQCHARTVVIRGDFAVSRQSGILFSSITGRIGTLTYSA